MGSPTGGPPDKWIKIQLVSKSTSDDILAALNNAGVVVTAAFTQQCADGTFLFLGFYSQQ